MKKFIGLLSAILLVSLFAFGMTACEKQTEESAVAPIKYAYTLVNADDGTQYYALKSVTVSDAAQTLIGKKDYAGLATLFNTPVEEADYAAPETAYTAETVRTFVVPTTFKGKDVKEVYSEALVNQTYVNKIVVGDNIETINQGAFVGLSELKEIDLPFVGKSIGAKNEEKLFGYIFGTTSGTGLTAVTQTYNEGTSSTATYYIPQTLKTVTVRGDNAAPTEALKYKVNDKGDYVFEGDEGYDELEGEEYEIPADKYGDNEAFAVAPYAFYNCSMVEKVNLNGDMPAIGAYTFYGSGIKNFAFNDETTTVGAYAFASCTSLKTIDFNNVDVIGEYAFSDCSSLGSKFIDGANAVIINATVVGESAFHGSAVEKVEFTEAAEIGNYAFHECYSLVEVKFDAANTAIGVSAFAGCTSLTEVDLSNIATLGNYAFYGCSKLATIIGYEYFTSVSYAFDGTAYLEELDE